MTIRKILTVAGALALMLGAAPAAADNVKTPGGAPCLKNNGNPCNNNNGNLGAQGNADHERVRIDKKPPLIDLAMPAVSGRGAYIAQIGQAHVATIKQTAPNAYARVDQSGDANEADVTQSGSGTAYARSTQTGHGNFARVEQNGSGQNVVSLVQNGGGNWAWSNQNASGAIHNGARLSQTGNDNDMLLSQDGGDNRAVLTQEGDGNGMTVAQLGDGNRLAWTQQGNNLSDLQITQTGGAEKNGQLMITQTGIGN
jgi:minor curlin subunit